MLEKYGEELEFVVGTPPNAAVCFVFLRIRVI